MKRCCANCKLRLDLEKLDYSQGGCIHTKQDGYICMAFGDEGIACWMVGLEENSEEDGDCCEMWTERSE